MPRWRLPLARGASILSLAKKRRLGSRRNQIRSQKSRARVAVSGALSGKTIDDLARFDSADPIFASVSGDQLKVQIVVSTNGWFTL
jgi:hypothetical protein